MWTALASAGLGRFSPLLSLLLGLLAALALRAYLRRSTTTLPVWTTTDTAALLLAASTLFLTLPPGEMILGGWDPGVYLHTAVELAHQKTLQLHHPDLLDLPPEDQPLFIRPLHGPGGIPEPFGGMRILPNGKVTPQFYHAYPALMAIPATWGGVRAALTVNPLLNLLSILSFYALVSCWTSNRRWGLAAAALLALHPAQVWQARFSTAEMLTQLLLLTGFALLLWWNRQPTPRNFAALLGGTALGLAQLTRYDTLVPLAIAIPLLLWSLRQPDYRPGILLALGVLLLAALHVTLHQTFVAPYYQPLGPLVAQALVAVAVVTILGILITATPWGGRILNSLLPIGLTFASLAWLGWMAFNLIYRPTLHQRTNFIVRLESWMTSLGLGGLYPVLVGPESRTILFLQSTFGFIGLALALLGVVILIWTSRTPVARAFTWAGIAVTLLLTWQPYNDLFMMWVSRRYIPLVNPFLLLALVVLCAQTAPLLHRRFPLPIPLTAPLLLLVGALMLPSTHFLAKHRDWPGLTQWFQELNHHLPPSAILYTDQAGFAAPLRFLWGHQTYELHFVNPQRRAELHHALDRAILRHPEIYVLTQFPPTDPDAHTARWTPILHHPLSTHILEQTPASIPTTLRGRGGNFHLYRLTESGQSSVVSVQENPNPNQNSPLHSPPEP
ncbi:MAG TPA: hypothetical protein PKE55_03145 [Kiritimatiellia bacterium]|nr:hypothetical protein [Kiritimatiellia bacterium]